MDGREKLIETARELFWDRGYSATSPKLIQSVSGVGQGSMYHHFASKEALAAEAMRRNATELHDSTTALLERAPSPFDAVLAYVRSPRAALRGCVMGRMTQDVEVLDSAAILSPIAETLTWYRVTLAGLLRDAQATGQIRADVDTEAVAATVTAIIQGAHVLARAERSADTFQLVTTGAVQLLEALRTEDARP